MRNSKGFTLIELLVVIAIIGLLSTLAVIALNSARAKSRDTKRVSDVKQIQTALELYYADSNGYPVSTAVYLGGFSGQDTAELTSVGFTGAGSGTGTTYMGQVPKAPTPADNCADNAMNETGNNYIYTAADSSTYSISFCLGAQTGDLLPGDRIASPEGLR